MLDFVENTLCVPARVLYEDLGVCSYDHYHKLVQRGKLKKVVTGGNGRQAMLDYERLPDAWKMAIKQRLNGRSPWQAALGNELKGFIEHDLKAADFFDSYEKPDGSPLSFEKKRQYLAEANVLNAIDRYIREKSGWGYGVGSRKVNRWEIIATEVNNLQSEEIPHNLPRKERPLRNKFMRFQKEGYESLVHKGIGNSNTEKLTVIAKSWLLSRWATPIEKLTLTQLFEEFNALALERGWEKVEDQKTIRNYLYRPEIKEQWWGHRYGELKAKEKYAYQHSTKLPTMRDSLWYSDGTKLNLYYLEDGKVQTTQVYEVMDAYSEVFLGFHISKSEDFAAQYAAFKMAAVFSGHRPYECRYDNQGGHKKLQSGNFLTKLSHLSIRTAPYNGKSKTIENAFYRFQASYLHKEFGFTGQNITAKKLESRANMEYILANKHMLKSYDEAVAAYISRRNEWNRAAHPLTGRPRIEMYQSSTNEKAPKIGFMDMVDLFWIEREKPVTYTAYGLTITEKKRKYTYARYDENRVPDVAWHRSHVDERFIVKFDPEDMSSICIYRKTPSGHEYCGQLQEKIVVHRGKQEAEDGEAEFLAAVDKANKVARIDTRDKMDRLLEQEGLLPEQHGFVSPALKGIESSSKSKEVKARRKVDRIGVTPGEIGEYEKAISNDVAELSMDEVLYRKI